MRERPILMTPENGQKSHDGTKTQTRRIVKPQPTGEVEWYGYHHSGREQDCGFYPMKGNPRDIDCWEQVEGSKLVCPYGVVGDRLWVREPWEQVHPLQAAGRFSLPGRAGIPGPPSVEYRVIYRGEGEYPRLHFQERECEHPYRELCLPGCQRSHVHPEESWHGWTPSIHMPRWACRTVLELTEVRVERMQKISHEDALAEGCTGQGWKVSDTAHPVVYPFDAFRTLWESITGPGSWALNPWVWVLTFRRVN